MEYLVTVREKEVAEQIKEAGLLVIFPKTANMTRQKQSKASFIRNRRIRNLIENAELLPKAMKQTRSASAALSP